VTFFPWTFHIQDWFCSELVIFVKYRFPASGACRRGRGVSANRFQPS
jgi:hypothetical protein